MILLYTILIIVSLFVIGTLSYLLYAYFTISRKPELVVYFNKKDGIYHQGNCPINSNQTIQTNMMHMQLHGHKPCEVCVHQTLGRKF